MKLIHSLLISLLFTSLPTIAQKNGSVDWDGVHKSFEAYTQYPSTKNAIKVISLLPERDHVTYTGEKNENDAIQFVYQNLGMLERQVISRDPNSIKLAFRLKGIADGAFAEDLDVLLGQLIRIDPTLFLRQLKNANIQNGRLDALVGNYGDIYVDKVEAQRLETKERIRALETVSDSALKEIQDKCLVELKAFELQLAAEFERQDDHPHVGTFKIKYPPTNAKITSGAQAARSGGNWLMLPISSNNPDTIE